jgi:GAF domain-containing protein
MLMDGAAFERTIAHLHEARAADIAVELQLQLVIDAAQSLFNVDGTGLMCLDDEHVLRFVAASDRPGRVLEVAQVEHGVGPCVDAVIVDQIVRCTDIRRVDRYAPIAEAVASEGVIAVLGVPVRVEGGAVGSLNVYADQPREWDDTDIQALAAFAGLIEGVLGAAVTTHRQGRVIEQLEYALQNRISIERAIGVIMGRDRTDAVSAFNELRSQARSQRRRVADLAHELLEALVPDGAALTIDD